MKYIPQYTHALIFCITVRPTPDREIIFHCRCCVEGINGVIAVVIAKKMITSFRRSSLPGDKEWFLREITKDIVKEKMFFSAINLERRANVTAEVTPIVPAVINGIFDFLPELG